MREIKVEDITAAIAELCQKANLELGDNVLIALKEARRAEGHDRRERPLAAGKQAIVASDVYSADLFATGRASYRREVL